VILVMDALLTLFSLNYLYQDLRSNFLAKSILDDGATGVLSKFISKVWNLDFFNVLSLAASSFTLVCAILHFLRQSAIREVAAVTSVLLLLNVLNYVRGFSQLGPLVQNVVKICVDIVPFLVLLFLILAGFTNAFNIMFSETSKHQTDFESQQFDTIFNTFMTTFGMMLGDFNLGDFYSSADRNLMNVLFIIYILLVNIVLLNMLIAIMGDTYARVSADAASEFQCARAQLIVKILNERTPEQLELFQTKFKWIYVLEPATMAITKDDDEKNELIELNANLREASTKLDELTALMKSKI